MVFVAGATNVKVITKTSLFSTLN